MEETVVLKKQTYDDMQDAIKDLSIKYESMEEALAESYQNAIDLNRDHASFKNRMKPFVRYFIEHNCYVKFTKLWDDVEKSVAEWGFTEMVKNEMALMESERLEKAEIFKNQYALSEQAQALADEETVRVIDETLKGE